MSTRLGLGVNKSDVINRGSKAPTAAGVTTVVTANANRVCINLYNAGTVDVYIGDDAALTTSTAYAKLIPGAHYSDENDLAAIYCRTASGTGDLRYKEVE